MLSLIKDEMQRIGVPYRYNEWKNDKLATFFVGLLYEVALNTEDGRREFTLILSGYTKNKMSAFNEYIDKLHREFRTPKNYMRDGKGYAIVYNSSQHIRTDLEGVNECEIQLTIFETED